MTISAKEYQPFSVEPCSPQADPLARGGDPGGLLELVLAATNDGLMDWNLVTGAISYSERWKGLHGYEAHELVDSPSLWRLLSHPDDLAEAEAALRDHHENLWPLSHTWRFLHKNGEWRWSLCRAVTLQNAQHQPFRCVCVFTDVTDQVLTERSLADLTRRNELLLTSAGEGFLGIDEAATITFANPAAHQFLGLVTKPMTGTSLHSAFRHGCPTDRPCTPASCAILTPFRTGQAHKVSNAVFQGGEGPAITVDYVSTPARNRDQVVGVVLNFRDVTEQRRIEAQRMQGQKLEALGQLAAGIAHEINTPMQFIGDNVAFLETAFSDLVTLVGEYRTIVKAYDERQEASDLGERTSEAEATADVDYLAGNVPPSIASTKDGIERVRKIVYAMKEFSHPGQADKAPADLNHAIECTTVISANTWKHVARLELKLDPDLPKVSCHLGEVNQVVLNLIVNAAHAIADANAKRGDGSLGIITVETSVQEGTAEIRISDTGVGIPEAVRHRLFEPFFTTKEVGKGTGQGLTLARSMIVDRHGGSITFTSEMGRGTTFIVRIPVEPPPSA